VARRTAGDDVGQEMHRWVSDLFPITRSLTGDGVRTTLAYVAGLLPGLEVHEVPSGTQAFGWTVPDEWNLRSAYVETLDGARVIDSATNNLHVVGYSQPVDLVVDRGELDRHLHSLPGQPTAIPYVTSYYTPTWGFCVSEEQRAALGGGPFHVVIDATLEPGSLTYGELVLQGSSEDEVLLSTYVCHPSMANNELSGPAVTTALGRWLAGAERRLTYRLVFLPETIGSILYLSRHLEHLKRRVVAGWVVTCAGDDRTYSYVPSRLGGTLADRVSLHVLQHEVSAFTRYTFLDRGSDERQYCSPGADLPVCSVMRSKYHTYPEYHTSLDDLSLVTPSGLQGSFDVLRSCLELLEANARWQVTQPGEPALGPLGLYPTTSTKDAAAAVRRILNVVAYCDGDHDLVALADRIGESAFDLLPILSALEESGVVVRAPQER
jgi:aminopeptidase-like protein